MAANSGAREEARRVAAAAAEKGRLASRLAEQEELARTVQQIMAARAASANQSLNARSELSADDLPWPPSYNE
jgi:hypothetical protein